MKHCQRDQLLEATLPSHDFKWSLMIFGASNRASAFQLLKMSCKLLKTNTNPNFLASFFFSDKKPKYIIFNYWPRGKTDELKTQHSKPNHVLLGHDFPTAWLSAPDCHPHELDKHSSSAHRQIWEALTPALTAWESTFGHPGGKQTIGAHTFLRLQLPEGTRTSQSLETFLIPRKN